MRPYTFLAGALCAGVSLAGLAACDLIIPRSCTAVGCENGAELRVFDANGAPLEQFRGVVRFEDGQEVAFACPEAPGAPPSSIAYVVCYQNVVDIRSGGVTTGVTIQSELAAEAIDLDLRPYLVDNAPNGEACGPVCVQASVDVTLGATP